MSLYAYNKTLAALPLPAVSPVITLPLATAAPSVGVRGKAFDVTDELKGLTNTQYTNIQAQINAGVLDLAWTQYPEYPTPTLTALAQPDVESIEMYVSAAGSNLNNGTAASPLASFGEAWDRIVNSNWRKTARIFIVGTGVPLEARAYVNGMRAAGRGSPIIVVGSFANIPGTTGIVTVGDLTGKVFTDGALAMPPGAFDGATFVKCLTSTTGNAGARANVLSNTATTVTLQTAFPNPIAVGDTFAIQLPSSELVLQPGAAIWDGTSGIVGWQGIKISKGSNALGQVGQAIFITDGLVIDGAGGIFICQGDTAFYGSNDGPWGNDGAANPFNPNSTSGTLFSVLVIFFGNGNIMFGSHMMFGVLGFTAFSRGALTPDSLICKLTSFICLQSCYVKIPAGSLAGSTFFFPSPPFLIGGDSTLDFDVFDITGAGAQPAVQIQFGSKLIAGALTGAAGNGGPGITVDKTSQASIDPILTTLTGSAPGVNDVVVAGTPKGYGALPYLEPNTVGFAG